MSHAPSRSSSLPLPAGADAPPGAPRRPTSPARYAIGMFGTSIPINMFNTIGTYFYVVALGLDGRIFATVMGIYAVIDALDNPVYGYLSDRTRSRFGRRRPWMIAATPALALGLICFFSPPDTLTGTALVVWFAVFTVLTGTTDSMINANYGALLPELFRNEKRRALANGMRQGFQLLAMIISVALTPTLVDSFGYVGVAVVFGTVAGVVIIFTALGAKEDPGAMVADRPRIFASIKAMATNGKFWLTALTSGAYSSGMALVLASVTFFVTYTLGLELGDSTFLLAAVIGSSVVCLSLWTVLVRRFGPERIWRLALLTLALALLTLSLADSMPTAIGLGVFVGLGYSGVMATMDLIVARLLDEDTARTGQRREGMFLSAFGFFNRLNAAFIGLAFLLVEARYGFVSGDIPGERPGDAARFLISYMPAAAVTVAAVLSWFVRFNRPAVSEMPIGPEAALPSEVPVAPVAPGEDPLPGTAPGEIGGDDGIRPGVPAPTGQDRGQPGAWPPPGQAELGRRGTSGQERL